MNDKHQSKRMQHIQITPNVWRKVEVPEEDDLPSRKLLALLAALSRSKSAATAVKQGLAIWNEAGKALDSLAADRKKRFRDAIFKDVPLPKKFPATLRSFLTLVVNARTEADATKRLRDFYQHTKHTIVLPLKKSDAVNDGSEMPARKNHDASDWGVNAIGALKERGFPTKTDWVELAFPYLDWWKEHRSGTARESANARKSP